ncbi:hypothetical protein OAQ99_02270 [Candidatus Kapabacteria bacterium]|nr:hypothetical protein [Candidatus Kapabacteria bacterium]
MNTNYKEWTREEFIAFMMVFAASSDDIDRKEKALLKNELGKGLFKDMKKFVDDTAEFRSKAIIEDLRDVFCKTQEERDALYAELEKVVMADGEVNFYEKQMLKHVHSLIDPS